ncbi:MAG: hypothetical protein RL292_106 [Candidatus Parcubacteria bacterium]|jgi:hypothetical protein
MLLIIVTHWLTGKIVESCEVKNEEEAEKKLEDLGLKRFTNGFWVGHNRNAHVF